MFYLNHDILHYKINSAVLKTISFIFQHVFYFIVYAHFKVSVYLFCNVYLFIFLYWLFVVFCIALCIDYFLSFMALDFSFLLIYVCIFVCMWLYFVSLCNLMTLPCFIFGFSANFILYDIFLRVVSLICYVMSEWELSLICAHFTLFCVLSWL